MIELLVPRERDRLLDALADVEKVLRLTLEAAESLGHLQERAELTVQLRELKTRLCDDDTTTEAFQIVLKMFCRRYDCYIERVLTGDAQNSMQPKPALPGAGHELS